MKKVILLILDWFGINTKTPEENAIVQANTPTFDKIFPLLQTQLDASGRSVWLPEWQMWNSEVGHMTIGTWRINKQSLVEIEDMLDDGSFAKLEWYKWAIEHCQKNSSSLHLLQLFWPGGVHAMDSHLEKILKLIPSDIKVFLHLFWDGRDLAPNSLLPLMQEFEKKLHKFPNVQIASLAGRYFAMDRDNNRDRIQKAYDEIIFSQFQTSDTPSEYIIKSYEKWIMDEFIEPISFVGYDQICSWDSIVFLNFRSDRARQMTQALMVSMHPELKFEYPKRSRHFITKHITNMYFSTMTRYYPEYDWPVILPEVDTLNTLWEVIANHDYQQLHIAETEKFAHVTKFFNGNKQVVYYWEKDILVPSHKVATYDLDPEMSAQEIYDQFVANHEWNDFIVINFANWDMVWHTGIMPAVITAVEKIDQLTWQIILFCKENNYDLLITADHWNCEEMWTPENPKTAHTTNLVPFRYFIDWEVQKTRALWWLADIAPTVLNIMWISKPSEMTWVSLV